MKLSRLLVVLAALLSLQAVVAGAASASTVECQSQRETLRADTVDALYSFTNAKDFNGAVVKLDEAAAKLTARLEAGQLRA
jgi:hypothetical protein